VPAADDGGRPQAAGTRVFFSPAFGSFFSFFCFFFHFFFFFSFFYDSSRRERERKRDRPSLTFAPLSLFSISCKQIAAKGYASGSFDLPPRSQRLELAGRALADDAATLGTLGLAEAFVEQVAGFVVFDTEDEEEGKAAGRGT
jgi:hypothetical protein